MQNFRIIGCALLMATACGSPAAPVDPLRAPWPGPHGGLPPFDRVTFDRFEPALDAAIAQNRREVVAIGASRDPPTFENTIAALERAGRELTRVYEVYGVWSNALVSSDFEKVQATMEPRLAAGWDETLQNEALFRRIDAVHAAVDRAGLTDEQRRLVEVTHRDFVRAGAKLDAAGKQRVAAINQELATLYTTFGQNVRADEASCTVLGENDLAGLGPPQIAAAAEAAATCDAGVGKWAVANTRSAVAAFLTYSDRRDLRERVWRAYDGRGDRGAHDNTGIITTILERRAERARLLGYATPAHMQLDGTMAGTPERALAVLEEMWKPAVARVGEEVAAMQAIADRQGAGVTIEPWDYRYYAEKVRKAIYDVDDAEARPYLQMETLREGMFWVAGELFGLDFTPATDVPVYHPDVRAFVVTERATGREVGVWYFDPYAREGKYNGGQTDLIRSQERFDGEVTVIVSNAMPFVKPGAGEPALLGWRDAQTMFHEFGHAQHYLCSDVAYPSLAGGRVVRDYAEFPAQLFEKWFATPAVLGRFARHYQTGEPMPAALVAKLQRAATFNQGFNTVDYLTSALVEMKLHLATEPVRDPDAFERDTLAALGAPGAVGMRYRLAHFTHVFASDAYSAGYYRYLWADILAADAFAAFTEAGGPFDHAVADRLRRTIFSVGNTVDPFAGYRAFRGRDATIDALMRMRGFATRTP